MTDSDKIFIARKDGQVHDASKVVPLVVNDLKAKLSAQQLHDDKIAIPRSDEINFDLRKLDGIVVEGYTHYSGDVSLRALSTDEKTIDLNRRDDGLHDVMPIKRNSLKAQKTSLENKKINIKKSLLNKAENEL